MPSQPPAAGVVLDTNVVLDWWVFGDPPALRVAAGIEAGRLRWYATDALLQELHHVLQRPSSAKWDPLRERALTLSFAVHRVERVADGPPGPLRCSDASDQKFIDCALNCGARWLFTRDHALLRLARHAAPMGLNIVTPARWAAGAGSPVDPRRA